MSLNINKEIEAQISDVALMLSCTKYEGFSQCYSALIDGRDYCVDVINGVDVKQDKEIIVDEDCPWIITESRDFTSFTGLPYSYEDTVKILTEALADNEELHNYFTNVFIPTYEELYKQVDPEHKYEAEKRYHRDSISIYNSLSSKN